MDLAIRHRLNVPLLLCLAYVILAAQPMKALQDQLFQHRSEVKAEEALRFLPSGEFLSAAVMGYDNLVADLLWVRGIALFGDRYRASQDDVWYDWLFQLIDLSTELDPLDARIYKFGGLMLRLNHARIDQSTYVFHKGLEHCPEEFFLPFGIAMNYLEFKSDPAKAGQYMQLAAKAPNSPFYLRNLAASLLDETDQGEVALAFLVEQLGDLRPGTLQYNAVQVKIAEVRHDSGARALQRGLNEYISRFNRIPEPLTTIAGVTYHDPWPVDPFGGTFVLDPRSGQIRSSEWARVRAENREKYGLGMAGPEEAKPGFK